MESLGINRKFWQNRRVFLTGHTGFKGGWLALWLMDMGAKVYGYSLEPPTNPNLFEVAQVKDGMAASSIADLRDLPTLKKKLNAAEPEIVIHMAAQPLVRHSYLHPIETYEINVMGTLHLFEAIRATQGVRSVVNITTDKCYENKEWCWGYRENDSLGGHDPYSSSKACVEILTEAWRRSYMREAGIALATVRAGNVIGGGDWACDRLIPDFLRALDDKKTLNIRSPHAIRPWQHVLEPLAGYISLAEKLFNQGEPYAEPWNFGPDYSDARSVQWVIEYLCSVANYSGWQCSNDEQPHEAQYLKLDNSKANTKLGWHPKWHLKTALDKTFEWHNAWKQNNDMRKISLAQIHSYEDF